MQNSDKFEDRNLKESTVICHTCSLVGSVYLRHSFVWWLRNKVSKEYISFAW